MNAIGKVSALVSRIKNLDDVEEVVGAYASFTDVTGWGHITFVYKGHETVGFDFHGPCDEEDCSEHYRFVRPENGSDDHEVLFEKCISEELTGGDDRTPSFMAIIEKLLEEYKKNHYDSPNFSLYNIDNGFRAYLPNHEDIDMEEVEGKMREFFEDNEDILN